MSFVRTSKYRHVYGEKPKAEYFGFKVTGSSSDGTFCSVNPKFVAFITHATGGGSFMIIPLHVPMGRLPTNIQPINGHSKPVTELAWCNHNDNVLASADDDGSIKIWNIPDNVNKDTDLQALGELTGHNKKITVLSWHPAASDILLSASADNTIRVWHVSTGSCRTVISCHTDMPCSISWNADGSRIATTCKDKELRIIDVRSAKVVQSFPNAFDGNKPAKCVYMNDGKVFAVGFQRTGGRQYVLYDVENNEELTREEIDRQSGIMYPFYDRDNGVVFVIAKGEVSINYFEINNNDPYVHFLSSASHGKNMRGIGWMPKRGCDPTSHEIAKFYKLTPDRCEVISMRVPRKSELFQDDIFPDFISEEPALSGEEWLDGKTACAKLESWRPVFESLKGGGAVEKKPSEVKMTMIKTTKSYGGGGGPGANGEQAVHAVDSGKLDEILDDIKKLKATVRKQNKRIMKLEKQLGEVVAEDQDQEEE